jgi:class 3 adenylate cyclase/tetratricopeptide (TPR) repeat protein
MDASLTCASCGQASPAGFRFCGACGAAFASEPAAEVRKTVTIVFCDLVGSTALGERTDPEVLRDLMARYHAEVRTILERHGGTVEKFIGDAAMAVFGLPSAHEDDAERAIRASLAMRDAVAAMGLTVRIGVNTGEVVAGSGESLVTGDAVNVAARLEQAAAPEEILVGAMTERLVRGRIRAEAVAPLDLKGKTEAVPAFRVLAVAEAGSGISRPDDAPFVGRTDELERLGHALAYALESDTPQLATIVGPAGIGKSRLTRELLGRADARILVGRCLSYGEGITYWPLRDIASQVGDVRAVLAGTRDGDLAADRLAAAVGSAAVPASPEEIAWAFRRLCEALAARRPLIVLIEDIHWAEPTLLDLIEYVTSFAQGVPLFVLCTSRPDLFEQRPTWSAPRPNTTLVMLEPLTEADSGVLVMELGDLPPEARDRIIEAAEGNPLFVEQLVAMQDERGEGGFEIPPTLQALLAARIDRLADRERAVIERGSVEGRLFHRGAVAALLPESDRHDVGGHLLALVRKALIRPDRATLPGDDGFRFGHALIRDAAYEALPKRMRVSLHARYADWLLSKLDADAPDEIVGYHLEQAYRLGAELGAVDPAVGARAADHLAAAARAGLARRDFVAASNLLGRAVELVPQASLRRSLLVRLGMVLKAVGDLDAARAALEEGVRLATDVGDAHTEWLGRVALAGVRAQQEPEGAAERLLAEGRAAIVACEPAGDSEVLAAAWGIVASASGWQGRMGDYARELEQAAGHARMAGDVAQEAEHLANMGPYFIWGPGHVADGLRFADETLAPVAHVPGMREFALHMQAHMRARLGEFEGALEAMHEYRRRMHELGREAERAFTASCIWDVCLWAGQWAAGEEALRESHAYFARRGNRAQLADKAINLAEAALLLGQLDEAERWCEQGREQSASDDATVRAAYYTVRARLDLAHGARETALASAGQAVAETSDTQFPEAAAAARLALAEILRALGANDQAGSAAAEALALYERKGNLVGAGWARDFLAGSTG